MIQILLLILKIIGITLLVVLGLVLLVLVLVLFVPVFYRVRIVRDSEKIQVNGSVRFLSPLLSVTFQYLEKFKFRVRILGISFLNSEKPKREKKNKDKKKRNKKIKEKKKAKEDRKDTTGKTVETEKLPENLSETEEQVQQEIVQNIAETTSESVPEAEATSEEEDSAKTGFFEKIRVKIQKIRKTVSNLINKVKKLLHQKDEVLRILSKPESKQAIAFVWDKLKHLFKHILPRKMKGYVAYGSEDPATTGRVLGIVSVVYARTGQLVELRPNFQEAQLECDVELRGRIQVFTVLVIAVKVFLNRELKQLIAELKNVKNRQGGK